MKRFFLITLMMVFAFMANAANPENRDGETHWTYNVYTQYNMTLTGVVNLDGESMVNNARSAFLEVGAFCGDDCRGSYRATLNPAPFAQGYYYLMQIYSDVQSGEAITFKIWDHEAGVELNTTCLSDITFVADDGLGNLTSPYELTFTSNDGPNPPQPTVLISVTADPEEGGTVSGGGEYEIGSTCTLTATPNDGYTFVNWTTGNGGEGELDVTCTSNVTFEADAGLGNLQTPYQLTFTTDGGLNPATSSALPTETHWTYNVYTQYNMTLTGVVNLDGESMMNDERTAYLEVGAFCGDECRGSFLPTLYNLPFFQGYAYMMQIYSDVQSGETITFRIWDHASGQEIITEATYSFTVTEAASYVAHFSPNAPSSYTITAYAEPAEGGVVDGGGTYMLGDTCTLSVIPNAGYTFVNWTKDNEEVSTNTTYSFTVTEDATYVANFSVDIPTVLISATADPEEGGTVSGGGEYEIGSTCTLTATPNDGYTFVNWTTGNGGEGELDVTCTSNVTFEADAGLGNLQTPYQLTFTTDGGLNPATSSALPTETHWTYNVYTQYNMTLTGVVNLDGESMMNDERTAYLEVGAFCGDECRGSFLPTLYNLPFFQGYAYMMQIYSDVQSGETITFRIWDHASGQEIITEATFSFTVTEAAAYVAHFIFSAPESVLISATAEPAEGGEVSGAGTYEIGSTCTLTATANEGYTFVNWTKDGVVVSDNVSFEFTVTESAAYVANFSVNSYEITATTNPTGAGGIEGTGTYSYGSTCTLTVTPNPGYTFVNWTKDGVVVSDNVSFEFTVTEDAAYVANFSVNSYEITATTNPTGAGGIEGAGTYSYGSTCTLTVTPNPGYTFVNWTKDGEEVSTNVSFEFTVTEDAAYVANFSVNSYEITATTNPADAGTIEGAGTYNYGATCTLTVIPADGYTFSNWTKDGEVVSPDLSYTFTVSAETAGAYVANFGVDSYEITATTNPAEAGTIEGAGTYNYGATCTLTVIPADGYTFINWTKDGEEVSTNTTYSFTVTEDASFVANFSIDSYEITATTNPADAGTIEGAGTYNYGATCTLTVIPADGYTFSNWTKDGEVVSPDLSYTFTVNAETAGAYVANFGVDSYEITATTNPAEAGTIEGAGTYNYGATCTLTVIPADGYTFINWTKNGEEVSTNVSFEFTVTEDAAYVANFSVNSYEITATTSPTGAGGIEGTGTYSYGSTCTLTVTPNPGYTFVNWTKDGVVVSDNVSFEFTVTEDAAYVANFSVNSYEITATTNPTGAGGIEGAGTYSYGSTCTLTVTPNPGYTFVNWTKDGEEVSTNVSFEFTVTEDAAYVANFSVDGYTITVMANPADAGTVTGTGTYDYGTSITLTATAEEGYTFINWTKDGEVVSTSPNYTITVTEDAAYVANFEINSYEITATTNPSGAGTITGADTYTYGATCTLTVIANEGYTFINWTKDGEEVSTNVSFEFTVTEDAAYVANFSVDGYTITVMANPADAGTVTGTGTYDYGTSITLTATAEEGYTFLNWTKDGEVVSTSPNYTITVTEDATYVANFEINTYEIMVTANPTTGGTVTGGGTYSYLETCTLTATPAENYIFVNWSKDGVVVSTDAIYSFAVVGSGNYVATFAANEFQINVSANPSNGGTVTGAGVYNYGATATLTATANAGFAFVNWSKNGVVVSMDATYSFTVTESGNYIANFSRDSYQITAIANPTDGGTITGAGAYEHGQICTLTATAAEGYTFVNWTKNGTVVSGNATYSFTVTENATYVANFNLNMYTVSVSADPTAGGSVSGGGTFLYGESSTVSAMPNAGYTFTNWTKNGTVVSTEAIYTFTVTEDASLVAHFSLDHYTITVSVDPEAVGTATGGGSFTYGETCNLTATANTGYAFVNWTKDGTVASSNANYSFTVTGNGDYVAHFAVARYTLTVLAEPAEGGNVYGGGTYDFGHVVTLRAIAHEGYEFDNWTKDGAVIATTPNHPVVVREDAEYVAHFHVTTFEIKANTYPDNTGVIEGVGIYNYGETCTLTVTPNNGYEFLNWTLNGQVVSEEPSFSFIVTESLDFIAYLQADGVVEQGGVTVALYPNPAKRRLTIEASEPVNVLEIYNINGALVYRQNDCSDKVEINVETYAPGTYMIRLTTDSTVETRRFVKE